MKTYFDTEFANMLANEIEEQDKAGMLFAMLLCLLEQHRWAIQVKSSTGTVYSAASLLLDKAKSIRGALQKFSRLSSANQSAIHSITKLESLLTELIKKGESRVRTQGEFISDN